MNEKMGTTRREKIAHLISENPSSPTEIAKAFNISIKVVLEDLKHISRSPKYGKLLILPARCKKCGYEFKAEIKIPKKCPRCKSTWIDEPKFKLVANLFI